jgi:hypothetical protein
MKMRTALLLLALIFSLVPFENKPAIARQNVVSAHKSIDETIQQLIPLHYRSIMDGSKYVENSFAVIIQKQDTKSCFSEKCLTMVIAKCDYRECPYTFALAGPFFAVDDAFQPIEVGGQSMVRVYSFCKPASKKGSFEKQANTFLVSPKLVVTALVSNCGEK